MPSTCYREDPPGSERTVSSSSSVRVDWEEDEKELRIMEKIGKKLAELAEKANEQYVSSFWEDIVFGR